MSTEIHPTALVHPDAVINSDVVIGPYAVIDDNVFIGHGSIIGNGAYIAWGTRLGEEVKVFLEYWTMPIYIAGWILQTIGLMGIVIFK